MFSFQFLFVKQLQIDRKTKQKTSIPENGGKAKEKNDNQNISAKFQQNLATNHGSMANMHLSNQYLKNHNQSLANPTPFRFIKQKNEEPKKAENYKFVLFFIEKRPA